MTTFELLRHVAPYCAAFVQCLDLLQVPLEETPGKFKIAGINSHSYVWGKDL